MVVKILKRLGVALFFMLIMFYIVYALLYAQFSMVVTEKVYTSRVAESINTTCFVLRNEEVINSSHSGYISYTAEDGAKVAVNDDVAHLFDSQTQTTSHLEKNRVESELEIIKKLNNNLESLSIGINVVESQISTAIIDYNKALVSGDYANIFDLRNNMVYYINERKFLIGEEKSFDARVNELKEKLSSLSSQALGDYEAIYASKAGIFSSHADGYEDCFDYSKIEEMTIDDYQRLQKKTLTDTAIGKLVTSFDWYIICPVTADQALTLNTGYSEINVTFTSAMSEPLKAQLIKVNQNSKKSNGVAILKCDIQNPQLINLRDEEIQIDINYHSGLRIPKNALRTIEAEVTTEDEYGNEVTEVKQVQGVYIKRVKEILFREVSILYSASNYVICDPDPETVITDYGTLKLYDDVVVQGADLYDGKIVR